MCSCKTIQLEIDANMQALPPIQSPYCRMPAKILEFHYENSIYGWSKQKRCIFASNYQLCASSNAKTCIFAGIRAIHWAWVGFAGICTTFI